jgi:hypothetical protein
MSDNPGDQTNKLEKYLMRSIELQEMTLEAVKSSKGRKDKDFWDKLSSSASVLVALAGFAFTWVYNQQQNKKEAMAREQQLQIQRVQIVEKFMPHLNSKDENVKKTAVIAISSLGDVKLATELAQLFPSSGSIGALEAIADKSTDTLSKTLAETAIANIFEKYARKVVRIRADVNGQVSHATGILITQNQVVVADYMIRSNDAILVYYNQFNNPLKARIARTDGNKHLALLEVEPNKLILEPDPFPIEGGEQPHMEDVFVMAYEQGVEVNKAPIPIKGRIVEQTEDHIDVEFERDMPMGTGGAPVMNLEGKVVGIIYSSPANGAGKNIKRCIKGTRILEFMKQ